MLPFRQGLLFYRCMIILSLTLSFFLSLFKEYHNRVVEPRVGFIYTYKLIIYDFS